METTIDSGGWLLPTSIRDSRGLMAGSKVDVSLYRNGIQITPEPG